MKGGLGGGSWWKRVTFTTRKYRIHIHQRRLRGRMQRCCLAGAWRLDRTLRSFAALRAAQDDNALELFDNGGGGCGRYPSKMGSRMPRPRAKSQRAGDGVPAGRTV